MIPEVYKYQEIDESKKKGVSSTTKVLNDIVMILETDRVIIKTFNALIANFIYPVRGKIQAYLQVEDNENMMTLLVEN